MTFKGTTSALKIKPTIIVEPGTIPFEPLVDVPLDLLMRVADGKPIFAINH
ncbi:MAG: hypothetical protein IPP34_16655 [Bacteroidetes bacterium]|nr:hypothetical protein [Bacteroidota bacterium]